MIKKKRDNSTSSDGLSYDICVSSRIMMNEYEYAKYCEFIQTYRGYFSIMISDTELGSKISIIRDDNNEEIDITDYYAW